MLVLTVTSGTGGGGCAIGSDRVHGDTSVLWLLMCSLPAAIYTCDVGGCVVSYLMEAVLSKLLERQEADARRLDEEADKRNVSGRISRKIETEGDT